jgi:hypothetical protein
LLPARQTRRRSSPAKLESASGRHLARAPTALASPLCPLSSDPLPARRAARVNCCTCRGKPALSLLVPYPAITVSRRRYDLHSLEGVWHDRHLLAPPLPRDFRARNSRRNIRDRANCSAEHQESGPRVATGPGVVRSGSPPERKPPSPKDLQQPYKHPEGGNVRAEDQGGAAEHHHSDQEVGHQVHVASLTQVEAAWH